MLGKRYVLIAHEITQACVRICARAHTQRIEWCACLAIYADLFIYASIHTHTDICEWGVVCLPGQWRAASNHDKVKYSNTINIRLIIYMKIQIASYYNTMWNGYYIIQIRTSFIVFNYLNLSDNVRRFTNVAYHTTIRSIILPLDLSYYH